MPGGADLQYHTLKVNYFTTFGQPIVGQPIRLHFMLENLNKIDVKRPVDLIIAQIRDLISSGSIKPGEKLPPERKLAERLGVSRSQVREAINKLQFYGILKVLPQSGTVVTGIGITALEGLISDILEIENVDFKSLIDTRVLLEKEAARLAAIHRTADDLIELNKALVAYEKKLQQGDQAVEEDLLFHVKIGEASKNSVLKSLMIIITPDIVKSFIKLKVCDESSNMKTIEEHRNILDMIADQNPEGAVMAMEEHLQNIIVFSKTYNK